MELQLVKQKFRLKRDSSPWTMFFFVTCCVMGTNLSSLSVDNGCDSALQCQENKNKAVCRLSLSSGRMRKAPDLAPRLAHTPSQS